MQFVRKLRRATYGKFQIDTDGLHIYRMLIGPTFGWHQDHAQVVKIFGAPTEGQARYSPPRIVDIHVNVGGGNPNIEAASTSYVERSNLTVRMMLRRFTRLTNAHSKSFRHHEAALSLLFAFYNFCRPHMTLTELNGGRKCTPAMAALIATSIWSVKELIQRAIPEGTMALAS